MTFTVFLDRDGVFNRHLTRGIGRLADFEWLPGAREAFARLNKPGFQTCLCTNQPRVGLLLTRPATVHQINDHLRAGLAAAGGRLDHVEAAFSPSWFPHRRLKPRPGMLEDGAAALGGVDKARAVMVGDKPKDAQAARAFGVPAILVATTYDAATLESKVTSLGLDETIVVADLAAAVDEILARAKAPGKKP